MEIFTFWFSIQSRKEKRPEIRPRLHTHVLCKKIRCKIFPKGKNVFSKFEFYIKGHQWKHDIWNLKPLNKKTPYVFKTRPKKKKSEPIEKETLHDFKNVKCVSILHIQNSSMNAKMKCTCINVVTASSVKF